MSYLRCISHPEAYPALDPTAVPPRRPLAAPIAAPTPGLPDAAPIAAPSPAPIAVPAIAAPAMFWLAVAAGSPPACCIAHCLQAKSSAWNCSNGLPGGGSTMTLGPVGMVAHPVNAAIATNCTRIRFPIILHLPLPPWRRGRLGNDGHPPARTLLDVGIVALGILAVVPILRLLRLRLEIHWGLRLDDHRWSGIRRVRRSPPGWPPPPRTRSPPEGHPNKNPSPVVAVCLGIAISVAIATGPGIT